MSKVFSSFTGGKKKTVTAQPASPASPHPSSQFPPSVPPSVPEEPPAANGGGGTAAAAAAHASFAPAPAIADDGEALYRPLYAELEPDEPEADGADTYGQISAFSGEEKAKHSNIHNVAADVYGTVAMVGNPEEDYGDDDDMYGEVKTFLGDGQPRATTHVTAEDTYEEYTMGDMKPPLPAKIGSVGGGAEEPIYRPVYDTVPATAGGDSSSDDDANDYDNAPPGMDSSTMKARRPHSYENTAVKKKQQHKQHTQHTQPKQQASYQNTEDEPIPAPRPASHGARRQTQRNRPLPATPAGGGGGSSREGQGAVQRRPTAVRPQSKHRPLSQAGQSLLAKVKAQKSKWFYGSFGRTQAEEYLSKQPKGTFLLRPSGKYRDPEEEQAVADSTREQPYYAITVKQYSRSDPHIVANPSHTLFWNGLIEENDGKTLYFINLGENPDDPDAEDEILKFPSLDEFIATLMTDPAIGAKIGLPVALRLG